MTDYKRLYLKLELLINERLYLQGVIAENYYSEVAKILKDKIKEV